MMPILRVGNNKTRGFTMLELLVVMVLLVLLSSLVMIAMGSSLEDGRLQSAARICLARINYARSYAVSHRTSTAVLLDSTRHGILVMVEEPAQDATSQPTWRLLTTPAGRFISFPSDVTVAAEASSTSDTVSAIPADMAAATDTTDLMDAQITFTLDGQASTGAQFLLTNTRGHQRLLVVDALTGHSTLTDPANANNITTTP